MLNSTLVLVGLIFSTTAAYAGGMDRSGQSITALFEEGTYAEISFGSVSPDVTGVSATGTTASGNVAPDYTQLGLAYKTDINDQFSIALIVDQPFGASVSYDNIPYALQGTKADVTTMGYTFLAQYHVDENVSVYAGPRLISAEGTYTRSFLNTSSFPDSLTVYDATYSSDTDVGYVVGAAYEIPEIALRAAITYSSQTEFLLDGQGSFMGGAAAATTLEAIMPQTVNVDFQTGVAANTLAFANVRWADWSEAILKDNFANSTFTPPASNTELGVLSDFNNTDITTYTVGIGRRFSDNFAAQFAVGYENATGQAAGNLAPTDGYISYSCGGAYTFEGGMEMSGGIRYVDLGDTTTQTLASSFTKNSVTAIGLKLAYHY